MTVRELVREAQKDMRDPALTPEAARELLARLTALIGNCNAELREADMAYNAVLLRHLDSEEKANRARIRAEGTPEYLRKREAMDTKQQVIESVRSLKKWLDSLGEEMRLTR